MEKYNPRPFEKEKTKGKEALLRENSIKMDELRQKKQRNWISQEQYDKEREVLEEDRLEILTRPEDEI